MDHKQDDKFANPMLSTEYRNQVENIQRVFDFIQKNLEDVERNGKLFEKSVELSREFRRAGNALYITKGHNVNIHQKILNHYSSSIASAPKNTEELVLGYGNRSSLLMHLQHYEEALIDIDRALQLTKDHEYNQKLQARREKCLDLLNEQNLIKSTNSLTLDQDKELEKIRSKVMNFKPSAKIPCAADSVGLDYNEALGRHLVATRDIKPGEILIIEKSYACSPILEQLYLSCSHCLQVAWNGIPCDQCVFVIYCSEECKNEAFKEYHDIECPIIKYIDHTVFNKESKGCDRILSLRILIKALRQEGFDTVMEEVSKKQNNAGLDILLTNGILQSNKFKSCYNLLPHIRDTGISIEQFEFHTLTILYLLIKHTNFAVLLMGENSLADNGTMNFPVSNDRDFKVNPQIIFKLKEVLTKFKHIIDTNEYMMGLNNWQCNGGNGHKCKDTCNRIRGVAILPSCSLLNHSCTPNVNHICVPKRRVIVFSTCPIKKGEMLCDGYGVSVLNDDLKARGNTLEKIFSSKCKCKACLDKIDLVSDTPENSSKVLFKMEESCPASAINLYFNETPVSYEISEELLQHMTTISQLMYKYFTYYEAYVHSSKCEGYIEKIMSNLFREKIFIPNSC